MSNSNSFKKSVEGVALSGLLMASPFAQAAPPDIDYVLLNNGVPVTISDFVPYDPQGSNLDIEVIPNFNGVRMEGDSWKAWEIDPIVVTKDTVVTLTYTANGGELGGLTFLREGVSPLGGNKNLHKDWEFIGLSGTQEYGDNDVYTAPNGEPQTFTFNLSKYFPVGTKLKQIVLASDDDQNANSKNSFKDIAIYENVGCSIPADRVYLNLEESKAVPYINQDTNPKVFETTSDDVELRVSNNSWSAISIDDVVVTENTVLEVTHKSPIEGELGGVVFLPKGKSPSSGGTINLHEEGEIIRFTGDQGNYAGGNLSTVPSGTWETYKINLSKYFPSGTILSTAIFFSDEDGGNGVSNDLFRNPKIYEDVEGDPNIQPITLVADTYAVKEDTTTEAFNALTNDSPSNLTVVSHSRPMHGTVTLGQNNEFTYTPDPEYNGSDCFIVTAENANGTQVGQRVYLLTPPDPTENNRHLYSKLQIFTADKDYISPEASMYVEGDNVNLIFPVPNKHGDGSCIADGDIKLYSIHMGTIQDMYTHVKYIFPNDANLQCSPIGDIDAECGSTKKLCRIDDYDVSGPELNNWYP